jgi:hypothetical protein
MAQEAPALGLDKAKAVALAVTFEGKSLAVHASLLAPGPRRGIPGLFGADGPADLSLARKAPRDAVGFSALKLDLAATLVRIREIVRTAGGERAFEEMEEALASANRELGFSIESDLLKPLGADLALVAFMPEGGAFLPDVVLVARPRDAKALEAGLARLASGLELAVRPVDMGGRKMTAIAAPLGKLGEPWFGPRRWDPDEDPAMAAARDREMKRRAVATILTMLAGSYCFDDGLVYFAGRPQTIAEMLERAAAGSLADAPEFKAEVAKVPAGAAFVGYEDPRLALPMVWYAALKGARFAEVYLRVAGVAIDASLLPRVTALAPHVRPGITYMVADDAGIAISSRSSTGVPIGLPGPMVLMGVGASMLVFVGRAAPEPPRAIEARPERARPLPMPDGPRVEPIPEPPVIEVPRVEPRPARPLIYRCPMHPSITAPERVACPECGMKLIPDRD